MSVDDLRLLLDEVADTRELVLRRDERLTPAWNAVYDAWSDAHEDAEAALLHWRISGGSEAFAAYRAAQDREDAAQAFLADSSFEPA